MTTTESTDFMARLEALGEEQRDTMRAVIIVLTNVLESDEGCAVLIADVEGSGIMSLHIAGNSLIAPQLAEAASDVLKKMDNHYGEMQ